MNEKFLEVGDSVCETCEFDALTEEVLCENVSFGTDRKEVLSISFGRYG